MPIFVVDHWTKDHVPTLQTRIWQDLARGLSEWTLGIAIECPRFSFCVAPGAEKHGFVQSTYDSAATKSGRSAWLGKNDFQSRVLS
jgi:hypothetical protein